MIPKIIAIIVGLAILGGLYFATNHTPEADGASQPEATAPAPVTPDDSFGKGLKIN